jgi:hypothetical protein
LAAQSEEIGMTRTANGKNWIRSLGLWLNHISGQFFRAFGLLYSAVSVAGLKRRFFTAGSVLLTIVISFRISGSTSVNPLQPAAYILLCSVVGFTVIAVLTHDSRRGWRAVDYLWVCTTLATIVVALVNIASNSRKEEISSARSSVRSAFSNVLYLTRAVLEDDCQQRPSRAVYYTPASEPYPGACDRMAHFLPQMDFEMSAIELNPKAPHNEWGMDIVLPNTNPQGRWQALYAAGRDLDQKFAALDTILDRQQPTDGSLSRFILSTRLRYWYFILAFFLGLRFSKVTAEII